MNNPNSTPDHHPEPATPSQQSPQPPPPSGSGQWVFVPAGQSFTFGNPVASTEQRYSTPAALPSNGFRIGAGVVALSNLLLAVPNYIYLMFFVYGQPLTPAEGWANFFLLVSIIGTLVTGIRMITKHRLPNSGSTPWTLASYSVVGIISILTLADFYAPLTSIWYVLTGVTVITLCLRDLSKTADGLGSTATGNKSGSTFKD